MELVLLYKRLMNPCHFILVIFSLISVIACSQKKDTMNENIKIQEVTSYQVVEEPEPPPPDLKSNFNSVSEWLSKLATTDKPDPDIVNFRFGLFEHETNYTLVFSGSKNDRNQDTVLLDYMPSDMYYPLPPKDYGSLTLDQAWKKITLEIKEFLTSETGKNSFFQKAKAIVTDFNGENLVK